MSQAFAQTLDELGQSEGWAVLSACKQDELSHDDDEKQHGVFTYYLLEGLHGAADADGVGFITVYEASRYATIQTKRWAFKNGVQQNPELKGNVSGDIVLIKSGRETSRNLGVQGDAIKSSIETGFRFMAPVRENHNDGDVRNGVQHTIFVGYHHRDEMWKNRLVTHLRDLPRSDLVIVEYDMERQSPDECQETSDAVSHAAVVLLLITADVPTSKLMQNAKTPRLIDHCIAEGGRVIPLVVQSCPWQSINWLSRFQAWPLYSRPLSEYDNAKAEAELREIAADIPGLLEQRGLPNLPALGSMVPRSAAFTPAHFVGLKVYDEAPLRFDFVLDTGDAPLGLKHVEGLIEESAKLLQYFLTCLTIPEEHLWVNLSPFERDRIIPPDLGQTVMGYTLLGQDYVLKQFNASLMYPEAEVGQAYWNKIYEKARTLNSTANGPTKTQNRIWIIPERARILERRNTALIIDQGLDVLLAKDRIFELDNRRSDDRSCIVDEDYASSTIADVLLLEIKKEVNVGRHFAPTRQISQCLILAHWYKQAVRDSLLNQTYANQNKLAGLETVDTSYIDNIYKQYIKSMSLGVFNYIKEDHDPDTQEIVPRKYTSGGIVTDGIKHKLHVTQERPDFPSNDVLEFITI